MICSDIFFFPIAGRMEFRIGSIEVVYQVRLVG